MAKAFTTHGTSFGKTDDENSPQVELDDLTKQYMKDNSVDYYTAYEKVSQLNPELYTKAVTGAV